MQIRTLRRATMVLWVALLLVGAVSSWAVGDESPFVTDIGVRFLGADVGFGYRGLSLLPNVDTTFWAGAGVGYEWLTYYREPSGALVPPGGLGDRDPSFVRIEGAWRLGIEQGIALNERTKKNLIEAFLFYRGRADVKQSGQGQLLYDSAIAEKSGILLNTLLGGFAYDDLLFRAESSTRGGIAAEVSAEGNPSFARFNGTFRWFLPVLEAAGGGPREPSAYVGEFISVDYALGFNSAPVPLSVRQTLGGRNGKKGLGYSVRGVDPGSLDTNFKAVNNLEVRARLPALLLPDLVPGLVAFWDLGYYAQVGEAGVAVPEAGWVSSVGAGVSLDVFNVVTIIAYVEYRLDAENAAGGRLSMPAIEFGLHF
jgi:hypothetical protein